MAFTLIFRMKIGKKNHKFNIFGVDGDFPKLKMSNFRTTYHNHLKFSARNALWL